MTTPALYRVRDWDRHFSVADLRKIKGPWRWVPLPTRHDTKGYRRLARKPNGMALYGTWCVLLAVAAKCAPPGTLQDPDGPLSAADISDKTGAPVELVAETISLLSDPTEGIGWLEVVTRSADSVNIAGNIGASPEKSAYKQASKTSKTSKQVINKSLLFLRNQRGGHRTTPGSRPRACRIP